MTSVSFAGEIFVSEILTAFPAIMAHGFFYFGFDNCVVIVFSAPCRQETERHIRCASLCALIRYSVIFAPEYADQYVVGCA